MFDEAVLQCEEACENTSLLADAAVFMPLLTLYSQTNKQTRDSCTDALSEQPLSLSRQKSYSSEGHIR